MAISIKSAADIEGMRLAGKLAAEVLDFITPFVKAGTATDELDRLCHAYMVDVQASIPACLHYCPPGHTPFPKAICISVNDVACHGIPDGRRLVDGDLVNLDVTVIKDGYHGDTSRMFHIGETSPQARRLDKIAFECMWLAISTIKPGSHLGDIGYAIQHYAEYAGYSVVREICGHGIGKYFHEAPFVRHYGQLGAGAKLAAGMIFTVAPIINAGGREIQKAEDGWAIKTRDGSLSAQWEHTVLVTETRCEILTVSKGMPMPPRSIRVDSPAAIAPAVAEDA